MNQVKALENRRMGLLTPREWQKLFSADHLHPDLLESPRLESKDRVITSIEIHPQETRYLLTGSEEGKLSIYDLSSSSHDPVARSLQRSAAIQQVQWYPPDSGIFVTLSTEVLVWDTNSFEPVFDLKPFAGDSLASDMNIVPSCMKLSKLGLYTGAIGSRHLGKVKLFDLRAGSCAHTLVGHERGVSALDWSPASPHILASGGLDGCIRLWDIRKAGSRALLQTLDQDFVDPQPLIGSPYDPSLSRKYVKEERKGPNAHNAEKQLYLSHDGFVSGLCFAPSGHILVSAGAEGVLSTWNLVKKGERIPCEYTSTAGGKAIEKLASNFRTTCIYATNKRIWANHGSKLCGFDIDTPGAPRFTLKGHLRGIRAIDMVPDTHNIISGGSDGLLLVWGHNTKRQATIQDQDNW